MEAEGKSTQCVSFVIIMTVAHTSHKIMLTLLLEVSWWYLKYFGFGDIFDFRLS